MVTFVLIGCSSATTRDSGTSVASTTVTTAVPSTTLAPTTTSPVPPTTTTTVPTTISPISCMPAPQDVHEFLFLPAWNGGDSRTLEMVSGGTRNGLTLDEAVKTRVTVTAMVSTSDYLILNWEQEGYDFLVDETMLGEFEAAIAQSGDLASSTSSTSSASSWV